MGTKGIFAAVFQAFESVVGTVVTRLALRISRLGWFYRFLLGDVVDQLNLIRLRGINNTSKSPETNST